VNGPDWQMRIKLIRFQFSAKTKQQRKSCRKVNRAVRVIAEQNQFV